MGACRSRTNADDLFPLIRSVVLKAATALQRVAMLPVFRPQSSVTHPLDDLTRLGAIGHENKVDRRAVAGAAPRLARRWSPVFLRIESGLRTAARCRRRPGIGVIHCCNRSLTTAIRIISIRRRNHTFKRSVLDGIIIALSSAVSETTSPSEKRPSGLCARSGGASDFGFTHFEKDRQKHRQPILISKAQIFSVRGKEPTPGSVRNLRP